MPSVAPSPGPTGMPSGPRTLSSELAALSSPQVVHVTLPGSAEDYDDDQLSLLAAEIAALLNLALSQVTVSLLAGSVVLVFTCLIDKKGLT